MTAVNDLINRRIGIPEWRELSSETKKAIEDHLMHHSIQIKDVFAFTITVTKMRVSIYLQDIDGRRHIVDKQVASEVKTIPPPIGMGL